MSVSVWGTLHSLGAAAVVLLGSYQRFERLMKVFIGIMFVTILGCAVLVSPPINTLSQCVMQAAIPPGSPKFILGVIGGVGGSLTLLAYGYWIRERKWQGLAGLKFVRFDLSVSYLLTGLFGVGIMILAATVLHPAGVEISGGSGVVKMAAMLADVLGPAGYWAFLLGFWGAVTTSMIGVWQGVPYLFCDFIGLMKRQPKQQQMDNLSPKSTWYRGYLFWLAVPPLALLLLDKPVSLIILYSVIGALFMPFLAGTLLYMNSRSDWVGREFRNSWPMIFLLAISLILFGYLCLDELLKIFN